MVIREKRTITVSHDVPDVQVTVNTGPEFATLVPFSVVDASTGKPITERNPSSGDWVSAVGVTLMRPERGVLLNAPVLSTVAASNEVLIPARIPITVKLTAQGYADWYYPGTVDKLSAQQITLEPGDVLNLGNVVMHRLKK